MGRRKAIAAKAHKEARANRAFALLRNCPISPRKVRLLADMIRGLDVDHALAALRYSPQGASSSLEKLLLSAVANWGNKNPDDRVEDAELYVKTIMVDGGRTLKRIRPRAQGRANRILKRSCHIFVELGDRRNDPPVEKKRASKKSEKKEEVTE